MKLIAIKEYLIGFLEEILKTINNYIINIRPISNDTVL